MNKRRLEIIRLAGDHIHGLASASDVADLVRYIDALHEIIQVADDCMQLAEGQHCNVEAYYEV